MIDRSGRVTVDAWGRDRRVGPDVAAVRQNLDLIVDNGATVPDLAANSADRWGELDIHPAEVHLFTYVHPTGALEPVPKALMSAMHGPRDRYLRPDQRDFVSLTAR